MLVLAINICTDWELEVINYIVDCLFEIDEMSIYFLFVKLYCIFYSIYTLLLVFYFFRDKQFLEVRFFYVSKFYYIFLLTVYEIFF